MSDMEVLQDFEGRYAVPPVEAIGDATEEIRPSSARGELCKQAMQFFWPIITSGRRCRKLQMPWQIR